MIVSNYNDVIDVASFATDKERWSHTKNTRHTAEPSEGCVTNLQHSVKYGQILLRQEDVNEFTGLRQDLF